MALNRDLIQSRFEDVRESVDRLREMRDLSEAEFLGDQDSLDIACYRLLIATEAAIQICFHVSAQRLHSTPESYSDRFKLLGKAGILDQLLAQRLQRMARFRDVLVHVYWEIDYHRVYDVLREDVGDLQTFVQAVARML